MSIAQRDRERIGYPVHSRMGRSAYFLSDVQPWGGAQERNCRAICQIALHQVILRGVGGSGDQVMFGCQRCSLRAIGGAQFLEAGADMVPGCGVTDHQLLGNLLITQALDN